MKIIHIQQYYNDNMGYQENIFLRYQAKQGNEVILITLTLSDGFNNDTRKKKVGKYQEDGFIVQRIDIRGEFKKRFVLFRDLYRYLQAMKPDYIFHHSVTSPSLWTVCKYKKANNHVFLAVDNHADLNISGRNRIWKILYYNVFWRKYIEICDKYIDVYFGVTPSRCLFLHEELGVKKNKIRLLPIGADTGSINFKSTSKEMFSKYNIDDECFIIVHGGKITPEKQIDRILSAFSMLKDNKARLVLFGKIEDKNVKNIIDEDERIIYLGWLNRQEILFVLKNSDIGIWNTQHTTLLEDSIAVGLPMILRYYGSTSHLIDNSGLFLYDGSVREIYDKLSLCINNKNLIENFKKNAKKMSELLSYENIAKESLEYRVDISEKSIHKKFMNKKYSDCSFENFRIIKRK